MEEKKQLKKGQFGHPETTHRQGRRKGTKNRINALKLIVEEAALERNHDRFQEVIDGIVKDALDGDGMCRKLVWDALMSKGISDSVKTADKVEIKIGTFEKDEPKDIEAEVTVVEDDDE